MSDIDINLHTDCIADMYKNFICRPAGDLQETIR